MGQLLVVARHPGRLGDVAREHGHRGRVARGARVAHVEVAQGAGEHAPRQRRVALGTGVGQRHQLRLVGEADDPDQDERDSRKAGTHIDATDGDDGRDVDPPGGEHLTLGAKQGPGRAAVMPAAQRQHQQHVHRSRQRGRQGEDREEGKAVVGELLEHHAGSDRRHAEPEHVEGEGNRAQPLDRPRGALGYHHDGKRRGRPQEGGRNQCGRQRAGDLQRLIPLRGHEVRDHREHGEHEHEGIEDLRLVDREVPGHATCAARHGEAKGQRTHHRRGPCAHEHKVRPPFSPSSCCLTPTPTRHRALLPLEIVRFDEGRTVSEV